MRSSPGPEQEILFLVPFKIPRRKKDAEKFKDLFTLYQGRQGRITLPAEGPEIILEAISRLAQITQYDAARQVEALTALLDSRNPYLVESSLSEIERLEVADTSLLAKLTSFLGSPAPALRTRSLRVITQVFGSEPPTGDENLDDARAALAAVVERARNDADESVRVQAVTAIAAWPISAPSPGRISPRLYATRRRGCSSSGEAIRGKSTRPACAQVPVLSRR